MGHLGVALPPIPGPIRVANRPGRSEGLRVGGLTPLTTVDFPGELAAVIFCQGCPWRCRYCHNGHLLPAQAEGLTPWADVRAFLESRRGLLDAVVFSGGEPTLQRGLETAMREVRSLGFKVGLHTSGAYPGRLRRLISSLDWVGLDIKALPEDYPAITGVPGSGERAWESLGLLLDAQVPLQVRTTPLPGHDSTAELRPLCERLADAGVREHRIQHCRAAQAYDPSLRT